MIGGLAARTGGPRWRWRSTRPAFRAAYLRQAGRCSPLRSRRDPACFRAWTLARPRRSLEQGARPGERCADRVGARRRSRCALDQRRAGYALVDGLGGRSGHLVRCAAVERGVPAVRAGGRLRIGEPGDARDRARAGRGRRGSGGRRGPRTCRRCFCRQVWCSCSSSMASRRASTSPAAASSWPSRSSAWRSRRDRARVAVVLSWQPEALIVAVVDDGGEVPMPVPGTGAACSGCERVAAVGRDVQRGAR